MDNSSEWKKSPKVSFSEENYTPLLSEDDDTSIKRTTKECRESSEWKKSGKVSFSEEDSELSSDSSELKKQPKVSFSDEPPELVYEMDSDELAEREAIEAEAWCLPLEPDGLPAIEDEEELTRQALIASGWTPTQSM